MLPSRNGQTRPLVVDSLQLISIYSIYSLILSPRSDQRDAETIVISSYNISRRQRRCSLVSKYSQQSQLLINFVSIRHHCFLTKLFICKAHNISVQYSIFCLPRLTLQCTKYQVQLYNFKLLLQYISILLAWLHTSYVQLVFVMAWLK